MADSRWLMAIGEEPMADGRWLMAQTQELMADGRWLMAQTQELMADGLWPRHKSRWLTLRRCSGSVPSRVEGLMAYRIWPGWEEILSAE